MRAVYGALLLLAPRRALRPVAVAGSGTPAAGVVRVLGARHLLQAAAVRPSHRTAVVAGITVDVLHAASMLLLAAAGHERRAALASAAIAAGLAADEALWLREDRASTNRGNVDA